MAARPLTPSPVPGPGASALTWGRWLAALVLALLVGPLALSHLNGNAQGLLGRVERVAGLSTAPLAPLFTPEVAHWRADIARWAAQYNLEPNLIATVMQIESCGHPTVASHAGAQGLFQVMPFHFSAGEVHTDPDTNARRSAGVLHECTRLARGDVGLTLACYNGGPRVTQTSSLNWVSEVRRYYHWGTGIYADALVNKRTSPTLDSWLNAGGAGLCRQARTALGL